MKLVVPYLRKTNVKKIGIIGYCWGGLITMNLASNVNFTGAISIHGARLTRNVFFVHFFNILFIIFCEKYALQNMLSDSCRKQQNKIGRFYF